MRFRPLDLGDQDVRGLKHPIMGKPVCPVGPDQQAGADDVRERGVKCVLRLSLEKCERGKVRDVAQASKSLQSLLARRGQAAELAAHEIKDVVGVTLLVDARQVPGPRCRIVIEAEQILFGKLGEELDRKERIAARLVVYQLRERSRALLGAAQSFGDELA